MVTKRTSKQTGKRVTTRKPARPLTIHERIVERGKRIPAEELARHPVDGAANLEHYLYGTPKQDSD